MNRHRTALSLLTLVLTILAAPPAWAVAFSPWVISEMQPDIAEGGRANTISVHPTNNDTMLVASDSGGLFRTTNRGVTWQHIDGLLPQYKMSAVAYHPADPNIVIATTLRDFRSINGGGIWRSTNGGTTWTQVPSPPCVPVPCSAPEPLSGYEISIAPDSGAIYVATSFGVSYSTDRGVTWTHANPFGALNPVVKSVVALQNSLVIIGGPDGIRRSVNGGITWVPPTLAAGPVDDIHALARSPRWIDQAYVVNRSRQLYYTENGGDTWTQMTGTPAGSISCRGTAFIKPMPSDRLPQTIPNPPDQGLYLWFGNRCGLYGLYAPALSPRTFNYSGTWVSMNIDHTDTRDLAFETTGRALLLGTNGGVHSTPDGGSNWTLTGGGRNGYNALQIFEVRGQRAGLNRYDLYFGTRDNSLWSSANSGRTWTRNSQCCEGWFIDGERSVPATGDSVMTFVANDRFPDNFKSGALFSGVARWLDPQTPESGSPLVFERWFHIQGVRADSRFAKGLAYTTDLGVSWQQYARFAEDRRDQPKLSKPFFIPTVYQPIFTGRSGSHDLVKLVRVTRGLAGGSSAFVRYPRMTGFGGLGMSYFWYVPFGVDPSDSFHLIAPDLVNEKMMESRDAGNTWTEIAALTALVKDGGRYLFAYDGFTNVTAVSFNKDYPHLVAVGTAQGGVYISSDRGATWSRVAGSDRATGVMSIDWKSGGEAHVSTFGRGLWKITSRIIAVPPLFETYCSGLCTTLLFGSSTQAYSNAVLVFHGRIQGARASNGVLQEVFVTPGSSTMFFTESGDLGAVQVTESETATGFQGLTPPATPAGRGMVGITLSKTNTPLSAAFTQNPLVLYTPTEREKTQDNDPIGDEISPIAGKPYLSLDLSSTNCVDPEEVMQLSGTSLPPSTSVEVAINEVVTAKAKTNERGEIVLPVTAPERPGRHTLKLLDASTRQMIQGVSFFVRE